MLNFFRNKEKGFTLVEVLVVVIIVALLAAIAVPIYLDYVESARATQPRAVIDAIKSKSQIYYQNRGYWPNVIEDLDMDKDEAVDTYWSFEFTSGGGSSRPAGIKATSTSEFPAGAGKEVLYNWNEGKWEGYGIDSDND